MAQRLFATAAIALGNALPVRGAPFLSNSNPGDQHRHKGSVADGGDSPAEVPILDPDQGRIKSGGGIKEPGAQ